MLPTIMLFMWLGSTCAEQNQVTPIQKVLTLMEEMKAKAISAKNDEEVKFSAFSTWCANTKKSKTAEIETGNQKNRGAQSSN